MPIRFEIKGKQLEYLPNKKNQTFHIPYQKNTKSGDKIIIPEVLSRDKEFGQPYLKDVKLIGEVIKNGLNKKIFGMKYKAKKRTKRTWGHREKYTEIKIVAVEG